MTAADEMLTGSPVVVAAARSYARRDCTVVETSMAAAAGIDGVPGSALLAADLGIAECTLDEGTDPALLGPGIDRLAATGWEVTVLVPARRMGEAHRALRGRSARLQPWWLDPDGAMCFGGTEVP
jgi:hypothetical protein